jgi:hypothetical protein
MRLFRRRDQTEGRGATALVDPSNGHAEASLEEIQAEIESLSRDRDRDSERRLLDLRHAAAIRLMDVDAPAAQHPAPAFGELSEEELPAIAAGDVTPELLRAGILRDGCLLVRNLVDRETALSFARQIERAFEEREREFAGEPAAEGYYEVFEPHARFGPIGGREWIREGGGVLAADSPMLAFDMIEMFRTAGVISLVEGYLGEPVLISAQKSTLRKAAPSVAGAWHQDGNFMGQVRSVNLWLSLSRCGDEAPGLDIVPKRLDELVRTQTDEALLDIQVSQEKAEQAAGDTPILRPIFEPGDALFFDELFLHKTGSDPSMPNPRFAIENWFFGASAFPSDYAPLAV